MKQNDLQKQINGAYQLLAAVPVSGDMVEVMAEARQRLRAAYHMAGKAETEPQEEGPENG